MFECLKKCMELRRKYINLSLQNNNPRDADDFQLTPTLVPQAAPSNHTHTAEACGSSAGFAGSKPKKPGDTSHSAMRYDLSSVSIPGDHRYCFALCEDGIFRVSEDEEKAASRTFLYQDIPDLGQFFRDLEFVTSTVNDGPTKTLAFKRLRFLEAQFEMYLLMNETSERAEQCSVPHRDFYNVYKNDAHVHHSACMNLKHLLSFIKRKLKFHGSDVVIFRDGKYLTLEEVFESLHTRAHELSIDALDMHAHQDSFHRFDKFNLKYNPLGESRLREIFLKSENLIKGRYLAELTREVFHDLERSKYQLAEYRISIYGRSPDEWAKLAAWVCNYQLFSPNVRWIIQLPRLYNVYRAAGTMENFQVFISNVFRPLFEVTKDPSSDPALHIFLSHVVGFDSVDDESKPEMKSFKKYPVAREWDFPTNPPYSYYLYYMYANLAHLNRFRKERNFNIFPIRPHSGEAGDTDHLSVAFLTSLNICHGVLLRKVPAMQYLYYLMQIGIAMSPLSNNSLFLTYDRNPFTAYLKRGLNVSLSTDDPLQFHFTREPLIEEYSVATQIYKLSPADLGELCKNSVMQGCFELNLKRKWLGRNCQLFGVAGNDIGKTNIPNLRAAFREKSLVMERDYVLSLGSIPVVPLWNPEVQMNLLEMGIDSSCPSPSPSISSVMSDHSCTSAGSIEREENAE